MIIYPYRDAKEALQEIVSGNIFANSDEKTELAEMEIMTKTKTTMLGKKTRSRSNEQICSIL